MSEVKHYCEDSIVEALKRLMSQSSTCRVAVAYCGAAAYKFFPESPALLPSDLRIVVDASEGTVKRGLTNPEGLLHLLGLTTQLRSLGGLHAKAFIFDESTAVVGSVNMSESSITQQYQLALEVSDSKVVRELIDWFDKKMWAKADALDFKSVSKLKDLWPGNEFQARSGKKKGKFPDWHGEVPQPPLGPSDFSIGLGEKELTELLAEFQTNTCKYSKTGRSCLQIAIETELDHKVRSDQFHSLMANCKSWKSSDLATVFDLAYTNGAAAKMRKPLFVQNSPPEAATSLKFLVEGAGDPYIRFERLCDSKGSYNLKGLGPAGLIFLLHLWNPQEFPVVDAPVEEAFKRLKVVFHRRASKRGGQAYKDRAAVIRLIADRTGLQTFSRVDHFLDAIAKDHIGSIGRRKDSL
jgi:hypothetical protein